MISKFLVLFICIFLSNYSKAQSYAEQWEKYSVELKKMTEYDSTYIALVFRRDSALAGVPAPDFSAKTISNQYIQLSKLQGQVVVLNFWYTACKPCIEEMPILNSMVTHFQGKEIKFISLANEDAPKLKAFLKKTQFNFIHIPNSHHIRQDILKLFSAWPYTLIIDKKGKIAKIKLGQISMSDQNSYTELLEKLVNEKP